MNFSDFESKESENPARLRSLFHKHEDEGFFNARVFLKLPFILYFEFKTFKQKISIKKDLKEAHSRLFRKWTIFEWCKPNKVILDNFLILIYHKNEADSS